jgi:hypothetical protein
MYLRMRQKSYGAADLFLPDGSRRVGIRWRTFNGYVCACGRALGRRVHPSLRNQRQINRHATLSYDASLFSSRHIIAGKARGRLQIYLHYHYRLVNEQFACLLAQKSLLPMTPPRQALSPPFYAPLPGPRNWCQLSELMCSGEGERAFELIEFEAHKRTHALCRAFNYINNAYLYGTQPSNQCLVQLKPSEWLAVTPVVVATGPHPLLVAHSAA